MPPTKTWKEVERRVANFFGCRRQRLSGSSGRSDQTASDTDHPWLYIEVKHRQKFAVQSLFDDCVKKAKKEDKIPVLVLHEHGRHGFLVCVAGDDLAAVMKERRNVIHEERYDGPRFEDR